MAQQHLFDLARIDVRAAADDQVLRPVHQGEEAVVVERAHVAGVEPPAAQRGGGRLGVAPVALHHRVAAHQHLAGRSSRQGSIVLVGDEDLDPGLGDADRRETLQVPRMRAVGEVLAAERGDRHRALALAVDLDEALAHHRERVLDVGEIHRPAAVDDGLEPVERGVRRARVVDEALDHGRRGEHRDAGMDARKLEDLGGVEPAARRDHLLRAAQDVRQRVEPRAVRHRRGVDDAVVRADPVDVGEVAERHREQVAVRDHHALGPPGRAARVEEPGQVVGRRVGDRRAVRRRRAAGDTPRSRRR